MPEGKVRTMPRTLIITTLEHHKSSATVHLILVGDVRIDDEDVDEPEKWAFLCISRGYAILCHTMPYYAMPCSRGWSLGVRLACPPWRVMVERLALLLLLLLLKGIRIGMRMGMRRIS